MDLLRTEFSSYSPELGNMNQNNLALITQSDLANVKNETSFSLAPSPLPLPPTHLFDMSNYTIQFKHLVLTEIGYPISYFFYVWLLRLPITSNAYCIVHNSWYYSPPCFVFVYNYTEFLCLPDTSWTVQSKSFKTSLPNTFYKSLPRHQSLSQPERCLEHPNFNVFASLKTYLLCSHNY